MTTGNPQYDGRADQYAQGVKENPFNLYVERPAFLDLVGDVTGLRALDAGCGSGRYTADLVDGGATAVGFDQSADNIRLARERLPGVEFRVHDLTDPLDWLESGRFDLALLAMALHYMDERVPPLRELNRVLAPGGSLVLSTRHPLEWPRHYGGSYFDEDIAEDEWDNGWRLRWRRQPLDRMLDDFTTAGLVLDRLVEPRPVPELAEIDPEAYEMAHSHPIFIAFRLSKPS